MTTGQEHPEGLRRPYALILTIVVVALALLYAVGLLYLQFIMVIWGVAVMAGIAVYERRKGITDQAPASLGEADRLIALQTNLAAIDERLSSSPGEDEARYLKARRAAVEQDLRKLRWTLREADLAKSRMATGQDGLKPLPPRREGSRRGQEKRERSHLLDSLGEAEEVLATEPPESARARLELIASDVKAHHRLLRQLGPGGRNLGDYGAAWAALASVCKGVGLDYDVRAHASRKVRARLDGLLDLAASRGLVSDGREGKERMDEDAERWR